MIEIPEGAAERILVASRAAEPRARRRLPRPTLASGSRGRKILVAAVVIMVVGGVSLSLVASRPASNGSREASSAAVEGGVASPGSAAPAHASAAPFAPTGSASGAPASSVPPLPSGSVGQSAKVEANGSISLTIGGGKLQSVLATLSDLAASKGGFVASSQAQVGDGGSGTPSSGTIVLRVPEASFGAVVSEVQRIGHATSVTTTSTDVTGRYVDLQARIAALQASRQQYLTIMGQATSIGDILAVQNQLDALQSQLEQLQGQLGVLDNETTYGTLTVALAEAGHRPPPPRPPRTGLDNAWHDGIGGFVSGVEWLIRIAGTTLFVLLCLAVLLVSGRWLWRASRRRML
jgi:hypothetical protein